MQTHQRAGGDYHKGAEGRDPDRASPLGDAEIVRVVDKKWHDGQRIDNGQQRDEGFEIHGDVLWACEPDGAVNGGGPAKARIKLASIPDGLYCVRQT